MPLDTYKNLLMKKQLLIFFLAILWVNVSGQNCYRLIWSDEFDKNGAPDPVNWGYDLGNHGFGNNEVQNYTNSPDNARIENGILVIEARKGSNGWTSARLKSQGKQSFTYGRIEFRAKLPAGSGTWPALWMLGENISTIGWPACGEIDIMEHVGKDPGMVHAALHTSSSYGNTQNKGSIKVSDVSAAFHIYAIEWTETKIDFYVDNTLYYSYSPLTRNDQTWPFNKPAFIIMNIAMGGNWGSDTKYESGGLKNGIDPALSLVRMEVDYVRYYSKTEQPKISGPVQIQDGQTVEYTVPPSPGVTYNWSVPADATINSGQNTNKINVTWGNSSGNVNLNMEVSCGNFDLTPLPVLVMFRPSTSVYKIYEASQSQNILWKEIPGNGNTISLSLVPDLEVNYNITNTASLPTLKYQLGGVADLSYYNYIYLTVKTNESNPPAIIRLDVVDNNGNYNSAQIFKITSFTNGNQFHTYSGGITSIWPFNLGAVTELRMYVNFAPEGKTGQGVFWVKDVFFSKELLMKNKTVYNSPKYKVFPVPAATSLIVEPNSEIKQVNILNLSGQLIHTFTTGEIDVRLLSKGFYNLIITDMDNNLHVKTIVKQ